MTDTDWERLAHPEPRPAQPSHADYGPAHQACHRACLHFARAAVYARIAVASQNAAAAERKEPR